MVRNEEEEIVGGDLGNDSLKLSMGVKQNYRIANAVARQVTGLKRKTLDDSDSKEIMDDLDVLIESRYINGRYFVGPLAIKIGENSVATGTAKSKNDNLIIPLVTMLALNTTSDKKSKTVNLTAGLPVKEVSKDRDAFIEKLKGNYKVTFLSGVLKDRTVDIFIKDVTIVPEGVAVVINQMMNDDATGFRDQSLSKGQIGVIDIGAFTTDIPVIVNGKPDSDVSDGLKEGIANSLDTIINHVNDEYGITMTRSQLVERIEENDLNVPMKGKEVNLQPMIEELFEIFAQKIVGVVDSIWEKSYQIKRFYVVGGGAKALKKPLETEMKKRDIVLTFIPEEEDPQMQNAMGFWKFGKMRSRKLKQGVK